ncbi:uncharacterized protein LOC143854313 [Tasmannia lanceolata]|uniref:uncharacterized protein LOC143854313 n=1 Tax=Tasmannia lanceolata TaxID=3420 RepID=UPI0040646F65
MIILSLEIEMPQSPRINILDLKEQIVRRLGHGRSERYFRHLTRFLGHRISKCEFDKLCLSTIGRENVPIHNKFIGSILKNAYLAKLPPTNVTNKKASSNVTVSNGSHQRSFQSLWGDSIPLSPRKRRSSRVRDRPYGKIQGLLYDELISGTTENVEAVTNSSDLKRSEKPQSGTELVSIGSKALAEVVSVEYGEEVEQVADSPCVQSRSPIRAPLGIPMRVSVARKALCNGSAPETCHNSSELPDVRSLKKRLEQKLELEGLDVSVGYVDLLNNSLDAYLKRLIKPCMKLAETRCIEKHRTPVCPLQCVQRSNHGFSASLLDFRVAMESSPQLLGQDWPVQLEKICFRASEE